MNIDELNNLSDTNEGCQQLRLMFATLLGWKIERIENAMWRLTYPDGKQEDYTAKAWCLHRVPQFTSDLNAFDTATLDIPLMKHGDYWTNLCQAVTGMDVSLFNPENEFSCFEVANASALQRTIAGILTLQP